MAVCCGRCAYSNFSAATTDCDDFFAELEAIKQYKRHAERVLTRVNSLTGVPYANDPTIFGAVPLPLHMICAIRQGHLQHIAWKPTCLKYTPHYRAMH